jgi:hypothetical protein
MSRLTEQDKKFIIDVIRMLQGLQGKLKDLLNK